MRVITVAALFCCGFIDSCSCYLQISLALQKLDAFSQARNVAPMILAGDFNIPPYTPTYEFITGGAITKKLRTKLEARTDMHKLTPVSVLMRIQHCGRLIGVMHVLSLLLSSLLWKPPTPRRMPTHHTLQTTTDEYALAYLTRTQP